MGVCGNKRIGGFGNIFRVAYVARFALRYVGRESSLNALPYAQCSWGGGG